MADLRHIVRRESGCAGADFLQRIRLGLIGAGIILLIAGVLKCLA